MYKSCLKASAMGASSKSFDTAFNHLLIQSRSEVYLEYIASLFINLFPSKVLFVCYFNKDSSIFLKNLVYKLFKMLVDSSVISRIDASVSFFGSKGGEFILKEL